MVNRTPQQTAFSGSPLASDEPNLLASAIPSAATRLGGAPAELGLNPAGAATPAAVRLGGAPSDRNFGVMPAGLQVPDLGDSGFVQALSQITRGPSSGPSTEAQPSMFYSPSTGNIVVNGFSFNQRNATQALASRQYAAQPRRDFTLPDTATDWRPLSSQEYASYIDTIQNPGFARRLAEGWETGWRGAGDIAIGGGLAAAEATGNHWHWGEVARQNLAREYEENAPFVLGVQDIHNPGDFMTFAAQMMAQSVPWVVETIASMVAGAVIGGAVSGGVGAPEGAIEGFIAKEGVRRATMNALRTTLRNGAAAYTEAAAGRTGVALTREEVLASAARTGTATPDEVNRFFNFGERAFHLSRGSEALTAGRGTGQMISSYGAQAGSALSNYAMGVGDIRNTIADAGGDPRTATSIANVWGLAIPYALVESLGDTILTQPVTHLFPGMEAGPSRFGNALRHAGLIGAGEGTEEGAQYLIDQQAAASSTNTPIQLNPIDLLNNVAGGVFGGIGIGAIVGGIGPKHISTAEPSIGPPAGIASAGGGAPPPPPGAGPIINTDPYDQPQDMHTGELQHDISQPGAYTTPDTIPGAGIAPEGEAIQNQLRNIPPIQPRGVQAEREYLQNTLADPNLTPEQRDSVLQSLDALQGGHDVNTEAANRYRANAPRGVNPQEPATPTPYGLHIPITGTELAGLQAENTRRDAANEMDPNQVSLPPGLSNTTTFSQPLAPGQRSAADIYKDMATGVEVPMNEVRQLRTAIAELAAKNPTNPGYANVLSQIDDHIAQRTTTITNEHSQEFKDKYPELHDHLIRNALYAPVKIPGETVRSQSLPSTNDGLHGRTQEPAPVVQEPTSVQETPAAPKEDLIGKLHERVARTKKTDAQRERRAQSRALSASEQKKLEEQAARKQAGVPKEQVKAENKLKAIEAARRERLGLNKETAKPAVQEEKPLSKRAQRKKNYEEMVARKLKEENHAVQERGTEAVHVRQSSDNSERVRSGNAEERTPSGTRGQTEEQKPGQVQTPEVDQAKIDKIRTELIQSMTDRKKPDPIVSARNSVSSIMLHLGKDRKIAQEWAKGLTHDELQALYDSLAAAHKEIAPAEKKAARFGEDLSKWRKDHGEAALPEFVHNNLREVQAWMVSQDARVRGGLRSIVENILKTGPENTRAAYKSNDWRNARRTARHERLWTLIQGIIEKNYRTNKTEIPANWRALVVKNSDGVFNDERQVSMTLNALLGDDTPSGEAARKLFKRGEVQRAATEGPKSLSLPFQEVKNLVRQVQARVLKTYRFRTTHVFKNMEDFFARANEEMFQKPDGTQVTIGQYLAAKIQELKSGNPNLAEHSDAALMYAWVKDYLMGRAVVINNAQYPFDALVVFSDGVGTTRDLTETLEHEYIVHKGLSVLFPNVGDRVAFLERMSNIPGMAEKRAELIARFPVYRNDTVHKQTEEVLAWHAQGGPLALEHLLSAPEAADPVTKRSLWEDFKKLIIDWINSIFHGNVPKVDEAINRVIGALRDHAVLGEGENLNKILDELKVPQVDPAVMDIINEFMKNPQRAGKDFDYDAREYIGRDEEDIFGSFLTKELNSRDNPNTPPTGEEMAAAIAEARQKTKAVLALINDSNKPIQAAAAGTPEATHELLFGTNTDPGRPYIPLSWQDHMGATIKSNLPLMEKLQKLGSEGAGTTVKEALRKVGHSLETMGQKALRSMLIQKTMDIMHNTIGVARSIMTKRQETRAYAENDALTDEWRKRWGDNAPGSTQQQRDDYGRLAIIASNNRMAAATEEVVKAFPRLIVRGADGIYSINKTVFEEALKRGTLTKEEFKAEKGIEQFVVSGDGKRTSTGFAHPSEKTVDSGYNIYVQESRHMAESVLEMLEHTLIALNQKNDSVVASLIRANKIAATDADFAIEALQRMYQLYSDIAFQGYATGGRTFRAKQQNKAKEVLAELMRTMHNNEKVLDWTDSTRTREGSKKSPRTNDAFKWREQANPADDVKPFVAQINWFLQKDVATGKIRFERLSTILPGTTDEKAQIQYRMLGAFQGLLNSEQLAKTREDDAIQSALGNYIEFTREGEWRVFLDVTDEKGNKISVNPELYAMLPVSYTKSEREAKEHQAQLGEELAGTFTIEDEDGNPQKVKFDVGYEKAPGVSTLAEAPNIKEFLRVADVVGLKLTAPQMKQIANLIANAGERKRLGLQRANVPGMSAKVLEANSETMTRRAWAAAKTSQAWMLDDVFADTKNIYGDPELLQQLQDKFDIANRGAPEGQPVPVGFVRNPDAVWLAQRDLLAYANQMRYMSKHTLAHPTINVRTTKGEQKFTIEPEGRAHLDDATALRESLKHNELEVNLNDLLSKTGPLRMVAVVSQLGSIAAGIMNAFTNITHLPWVLIANHSKTGYGAGFDFSEVIHEIIVAMGQVFNPFSNFENSAVLKGVLDKAKAGNNRTGLTIEELEFMYQQTLEGELAAQQTYSMTGGTESNIRRLLLRQFAKALLRPFGAVEAANRRVSALVTYRLAKARYIKAGVSEAKLNDHESDEYKRLTKDVTFVVRNSQGDYSNVNTPKAFRGDLAKYVMLYKMFPLMTTQMLHNLPFKQQLSVLAVLFFLGGLKGEPFADDFMDIYDTLLQKLGVRHDSVELELIRTLESVMPGSSKWIMTGFIDSLAFGGTMSSRVSMGDIIPLTGVFREGADFGREIENAFGPAYSANKAILEEAWMLTDWIAQKAGLKPSVTTWQDLVRHFPQAQIRAFGEAGMMAATGQITDPQGRLTSDDVTVWNIFARALGLYPLEATKANTAVRLDRMHIGYMRAVRSRFILAYANAYRAHDEDRMDSLRQQVDNWNEAARQNGQTDMLINNFRTAAVRAGRAASQTTVERTIASAPDYSLLEEMAGILNADVTTDEQSGDQPDVQSGRQ